MSKKFRITHRLFLDVFFFEGQVVGFGWRIGNTIRIIINIDNQLAQ
jgi:hypothetical protein